MTNTMYSQEQIIEKIRGLLALAKSSNPNEAALAAQRATALMQKYNLDQAQVDLSRNQPAYTKSAYAGWFLDRSTCAWSRLYFCINAVARKNTIWTRRKSIYPGTSQHTQKARSRWRV